MNRVGFELKFIRMVFADCFPYRWAPFRFAQIVTNLFLV